MIARQLFHQNLPALFDVCGKACFLVDVILSDHYSPDSSAQLINLISALQCKREKVFEYICKRIVEKTICLSNSHSYVHLVNLQRLCNQFFEESCDVKVSIAVVETVILAIQQICRSLPKPIRLMEFYCVYEQLGALGHIALSTVAQIRRPHNEQASDRRAAVAHLLGTLIPLLLVTFLIKCFIFWAYFVVHFSGNR